MSVIERPADILTKVPPSDAVIKNAWYLAAWSNEVGRTILARRIADEPMVLFRTESGQATALIDRCSHRCYPLAQGMLQGDHLVCGYHGFTFDAQGTCVSVPGQSKVPASASVRRYPLVERDGGIWVFPGDPQLAAAAPVPAHPWIAQWWSVTGYAPMKARASLLLDNLLDLSHETYLHGKHIGSPEVAETPIEVERNGNILHVNRRMYGVECPPVYQRTTGLTSPIDRFQEIEFTAPGFYVLDVRVAKAGDTGKGHRSKVIYAIVPETARTCHDFWAICREDRDPADESSKAPLIAGQSEVVQEDVDALELLESRIAAMPGLPPEVSIGIDRGGLLGRRMLAELARAENS
jgi:phenylpropionate dioxygenase-like ring-hydroxylating dioxygenase large terminal subunit